MPLREGEGEQIHVIKRSIHEIQSKLTILDQTEKFVEQYAVKGGRSGPRGAFEIPMTPEEKEKLGKDIRSLLPEQLRGIIEIMQETCAEGRETLEFDIDSLPPRKCRELERYVKKCLSQNKKKKGLAKK